MYMYIYYVCISESVDFICRDSADTQYMLIQTNFSKSPKHQVSAFGGMEWWNGIVEWTTGMLECFIGHT